MKRVDQTQFLMTVLGQNTEAVQFCEMVFGVSQVLDDLVDGDRPVKSNDVIEMIWNCLIELPENGFYQRHMNYLHPLLASSLQDWTDSVKLERGTDEHGRHLAFVMRDQLTGLVVQCARLVGGYNHMQQISEAVRRFFQDEPLGDYLRSLPDESVQKAETNTNQGEQAHG